MTTALDIGLVVGLAAFVIGIALIGVRREAVPFEHPPEESTEDQERRATRDLFVRMLAELNTLEERYLHFASRALIAFAIVGASTVLGLGTNAYLLQKFSVVANANRRGVLQECHDIEALKAKIRGTLIRFGEGRAVARFPAQRCPHIPRPPR